MNDEKRTDRKSNGQSKPDPKPDEAGTGQPDSDGDGKPDVADPGAERKTPKGENL